MSTLPGFCNPNFRGGEILGPIYDGDEVILLLEDDNRTLYYLDLSCANSNNPDVGTTVYARDFGTSFPPVNQLPTFTMRYVGTQTTTISVSTTNPQTNPGLPYVMFLLNNNSAVQQNISGCASSTSGIQRGSGLGLLSFPDSTQSQLYLIPGTPAPLKLTITGSEALPWWPASKQTFQRNIEGVNYVLALAGLAYNFESIRIVNGMSTSIPVVLASGPDTITNPLKTFYIVPTSFVEGTASATGNSSCTGKQLTGNEAIQTGICAIGCQGDTPRPGFRCSTSQPSSTTSQPSSTTSQTGGLDCTQTCTYAFTDELDAQTGCFYSYCTSSDDFCGSGMCKSGCSQNVPQISICSLTDNRYQCQDFLRLTPEQEIIDLLGAFSPTTVAIFVGALVLIVLGVVLYVIYAWTTKYNQGS
jgi:hypothetical protein